VSDQHHTDRRLHPLSILFDIAQHLRDFIVPLAVAIFAARSQRMMIISSALVAGFSIIGAVWNWITYRFRYEEHDLVVRSGKIFRNERHIPYNRIQNIDAVQNVVHRLFGVAVVQVQTGSGSEPEATLKVLALPALADMRERVLAARSVAAHESTGADGVELHEVPAIAEAPKQPAIKLLHLPPRELLLAGLIENRGMALIAAAIATLSRFDPLEEWFANRVGRWIPEWARVSFEADVAQNVGGALVAGAIALLIILLFVRAISTLWAFIRLYDFTLVRDGDDLRAEYGLFTRVTATIPVRRVQTISLHQRLLHRRTNRAAIRVTTAGGAGTSEGGGKKREREWLAPIIAIDQVVPLLREIDGSIAFDHLEWQRVHPAAKWRLFRMSALWAAVLTLPTIWFIGWWAAGIGALLLLRAAARSRGIARNLGAAIVDGRAFFRSGWFDRVTTVIRFERIQTASVSQNIFDRRTGMATVSVDSAGTGSSGLQMPYIRRDDAMLLHEQLARAAVGTPFTW
jgi:putative membrane protein